VNLLFFLIQLLAITSVALLAGALLSGYPLGTAGETLGVRVHPYLEHQRDRAAALGWDLRSWIAVRLTAGLAGACLSLLIGTPLMLAGGLAIGFLGVPWYLNALATSRKLRMERALVVVVRTLVELITTSNQTIDHALVDLATNADPILATQLHPLIETEESIRVRLIQVAGRFRSPIATRLCVDLLLSLESSPAAFVEQAKEILIPQLEDDLRIQERNYAAMVGGRTSSLIVAGLMVATLIAVMHVDSLRTAYLTGTGQVVMAIIWLSVLGVIWTIGWITPSVPLVRWDLDELKNQMERRYA
jgi:Flp pilus assembly protein TadB